MAYRRIPPKKWPARDEVRRLAREHTVEAMEKLIGLMTSRSDYVQMNAARTVLLQGEPDSRRSPRFKRGGTRGLREVNVKIARFKEEKRHGADERDRKLPVVQRRRKGSCDPKPGGGQGLSAMRGQRTNLRDKP